ncbi:hypothetical protein [Sporosarcina sp. E16_8]|uniref:hypothetical protein n=1 Tax=Sporosarcina sp. E16_8 TaxID=2789295 RepID=UPI001A938EF6|nr:hypothetical protein [Sporosarcina sp. E16_8]MBO0586130.1 hypothetical protein [Sporosarcina sp. E16_8]
MDTLLNRLASVTLKFMDLKESKEMNFMIALQQGFTNTQFDHTKKLGRIVADFWQDCGRAFGDRRAIIVL